MNEADTCRKFVVPKLQAAGWDTEPHSIAEQRTITDGPIVGVSFDLATAANQPEADPFDLLCHFAFNDPLRTRRERAQRLRSERKNFFEQYGPGRGRSQTTPSRNRGGIGCAPPVPSRPCLPRCALGRVSD